MGAKLDKAFLEFHRDLARHNDRAWFNANKSVYEDKVKGPMLDLIAELQPGLAKVSKYLVADPRPTGGSLFRIYRDTRFSKDKSPYKTATSAHFHHAHGDEAGAPSLYLHLEPQNSFLAVGIWHPETAAVARIRAAIAKNGKAWIAAKGKMQLHGEALKRPPKGFDDEHPLIADLKRKDFIVKFPFTDAQVTAPAFKKTLLAAAVKANPFSKFLAKALGLPW